jgi:RNA polymerase sigma-54 factor
MKQGLQLRFSQSLSLTPQLQQAIKLLQMSTLDLNQEIDALIQTNPLLERGDVGEDEYGNPNETNEHKSDNTPDNLFEESLKDLNSIDSKQADAEFSSQDSSLADVAPVDMALSGDNSEFSSDSTKVEYEVEFSDEYNEFSNGSRWDENTTPDDDDSDFKQQDTLQEFHKLN